MDNPKIKPALIAGIVFGVLSALLHGGVSPGPVAAVTVCCTLYVGGGVLAVNLWLRDIPRPEMAPYRDGAVVGVLTGLFGAVAETGVGTILRALGVGAEDLAAAQQAMAETGMELPPIVVDLLGMSGLSVGSVVLSLVGTAIIFAILGTIGGLIGAAIFHKKDGE